MQMSTQKSKKNLIIIVPSSDQNSRKGHNQEDELILKPTYSVKNMRKSHFDFEPNNIAVVAQTRRQQKLKKNNQMLYRSLIALKSGAISAIAAKQEELDDLRSSHKVEDDLKYIEEELHSLQEERENLREEVKYLQDKLQTEREGYERMLQEKQRLIEELYAELGSAQLQIQNLEKNEVIKEKKIKIIEEENDNLFQQLQFQKIAHLGQQSTIIDSDDPHRASDVTKQDSQISFHSKGTIHSIDHERIKEIELKHKEELHQLSLFYEKRLTQIRQLYEKELQESSSPKQSHAQIRCIQEQLPISIKDTQVAPHKLSHQLLSFPKLSQCYSITKKNNLSKADSASMFSTQLSPLQLQGKLKPLFPLTTYKKHTHFPVAVSQKEEEQKLEVVSPLKRTLTEKLIPQVKEEKKKIEGRLGSFLLGAVAGGAVATVLCNIFKC